jgi:hypothetical protein
VPQGRDMRHDATEPRHGVNVGAAGDGEEASEAEVGDKRVVVDIQQDVGDIVTKFLGQWGRGTGSRYVVRYS